MAGASSWIRLGVVLLVVLAPAAVAASASLPVNAVGILHRSVPAPERGSDGNAFPFLPGALSEGLASAVTRLPGVLASDPTAPVSGGSNPDGVAYDPGKKEVFVADDGSDDVSVISDVTDAVVATVPVGSGPEGVAYDAGKEEVFVTNCYTASLTVIADSTSV